jgi:hypothetical protein
VRAQRNPWVWLSLAALLVSAACGNNKAGRAIVLPDGGGTSDGSVDQTTDAAPLRACLEAPTLLPRPPQGTLPCDLVPPGLVL